MGGGKGRSCQRARLDRETGRDAGDAVRAAAGAGVRARGAAAELRTRRNGRARAGLGSSGLLGWRTVREGGPSGGGWLVGRRKRAALWVRVRVGWACGEGLGQGCWTGFEFGLVFLLFYFYLLSLFKSNSNKFEFK